MDEIDFTRMVVYAIECTKCELCGEPICHYCGDTHYYDCPCPGPDSEDNN